MLRGKGLLFCAVALAALAVGPAASADGWLPHPADATWTYQWSDSVYSPTPTTENVTVKDQNAKLGSFTLQWIVDGQPSGCDQKNPTTTGFVPFQETNAGLTVALGASSWCSNPPPSQFPGLCSVAQQCPNSMASTLYDLIWGSLAPVLGGPLQKGFTWTSSGLPATQEPAAVTSASSYLGQESITVPAFPMPVLAAKVQSTITQAGAIGDPYGSGTRTVWWVYGVGPVKIQILHAGGAGAAVTTSVLQSTNQTPQPPPTDAVYFPLTKGLTFKYSWTNSKHMPKPEVQQITIGAFLNNSASFTVKNVSKQLAVAATYGFTSRLDGVTNLWSRTQSATLLKFPPLGPAGAPASKRIHFVTPFDLMVYGFNPILPAYPAAGDSWASTKPSLDYSAYGVTGQSKVIGIQSVKVPAGTFQALVVRSTLSQPGFPYGSGTRTSWFAPGKGLVKLVFAHGDHSVSTVVLLK